MNSDKNVPEKEGRQPCRSYPTPNPGMFGGEELRSNALKDPNITDEELVSTRQEEISRSIPIPEYKIGWIIGKKGSYINQVKDFITNISRTPFTLS